MELLRKVASFGTSMDEKKNIYILYVRSILEQSCVVWHSSLTKENICDLERIQKNAVRIIMGRNYNDYEDALEIIGLQSLEKRRNELCLRFAKNCVRNEKTSNMFPVNNKKHDMNTRKEEKFKVKHANTGRLKNSVIPTMQRMLNEDYRKNAYK